MSQFDTELQYGDSDSEIITIQELMQRWKANNIQQINDLCYQGKLKPFRGGAIGFVRYDLSKYKLLPDDTLFYLTDIRRFEDTLPETKRHTFDDHKNEGDNKEFERCFSLYPRLSELNKELAFKKGAYYFDEGKRDDTLRGIKAGIVEINRQIGDYQELQAETLADDGTGSQDKREPPSAKFIQDNTKPKEQELTGWLRETWIKENKPGGTAFFRTLKKYVEKKGSPIVEHYSAGKVAGIKWQTSAGTTGEMKKKTVQTKVSMFKKTL